MPFAPRRWRRDAPQVDAEPPAPAGRPKRARRAATLAAAATVLRRPYGDAPVSNLYLWGRKQDLAFELPVGRDPRQRHHVRWWRSERTGPDGRTLWLAAATYDKGVGFSHATGQITHHIAADVDAERDFLFETLQPTGQLSESCVVSGFHRARKGRNGGGDSWYTDGDLLLGVIRAQEPAFAPPGSRKDERRGAGEPLRAWVPTPCAL